MTRQYSAPNTSAGVIEVSPVLAARRGADHGAWSSRWRADDSRQLAAGRIVESFRHGRGGADLLGERARVGGGAATFRIVAGSKCGSSGILCRRRRPERIAASRTGDLVQGHRGQQPLSHIPGTIKAIINTAQRPTFANEVVAKWRKVSECAASAPADQCWCELRGGRRRRRLPRSDRAGAELRSHWRRNGRPRRLVESG